MFGEGADRLLQFGGGSGLHGSYTGQSTLLIVSTEEGGGGGGGG